MARILSATKYFLSFSFPSTITPLPSENKLGTIPVYDTAISFFRSVMIKFIDVPFLIIEFSLTSPPTLIFLLKETSSLL